jgi:hypothetical protein
MKKKEKKKYHLPVVTEMKKNFKFFIIFLKIKQQEIAISFWVE